MFIHETTVLVLFSKLTASISKYDIASPRLDRLDMQMARQLTQNNWEFIA